jgi:hypothetical protein
MSGSNVREDFLDEDNEIPSQRFVLLSFLSPEKVLARKDQYIFEQFTMKSTTRPRIWRSFWPSKS